jgi:hypothetical protein
MRSRSPMILLALVMLLPSPSLHLGGPDAAITGDRIDVRTVAPFIGGRRSVSFPSDPTGIDEFANGGWDDDDGAGSPLDGPVLRRPCRTESRPSGRCPAWVISSHTFRSRPLRC